MLTGVKAALGESSDGGQLCTNSSCVMFASDEAQREDSSGLSGKNTGAIKKGGSSKVDTKGLSLNGNVGPNEVSDG